MSVCMLVGGCHLQVYGCMYICVFPSYYPIMATSLGTPSPGPQDSPAPLTTSGPKLDHSSKLNSGSNITTLEPYLPPSGHQETKKPWYPSSKFESVILFKY